VPGTGTGTGIGIAGARRVALVGLLCLMAACARLEPRPHARLAPAQLEQGRAALRYPEDARVDLDALTRFAWEHHPALAEARADCKLARAEALAAGQRLPLSGETSVENRNPGGGQAATPGGGIGIGWTWEPAARREARREAARARARARCQAWAEAAWDRRAVVRLAWVEFQRLERRRLLLRQRADLLGEIETSLAQRAREGEDSAFAEATARLERAQARIEVIATGAGLVAARAALATAIGLSSDGLDARELLCEEFERPTPLTELPTSVLRLAVVTGRADLLIALEDYLTAEAEVRLAATAAVPDVTFTPAVLFDQAQFLWQIASGFTLPLRRNVEPALRAAEARRERMAAAFRTRQHEALSALELALREYAARRLVWTEGDGLLRTAGGRRARLAALREAGEIDAVTSLRGDLEVVTVKVSVLELLAAAQSSLAALESAAQVGVAEAPLLLPAAPDAEVVMPR
jgi:outer membrane protein TolC